MEDSSRLLIERVTDPEELPMLANIFDKALQHVDSFHEVITRCCDETVYQNTLNSLQSAIGDADHYIFKAVLQTSSNCVVVGVSHWFVGYISVPKVDPFGAATNPTPDAVEEDFIAPLVIEPSPLRVAFDDARRKGSNAYISTIRGKKHVCKWVSSQSAVLTASDLRKVAVLPAYQRRGFATKLMNWGVDYADHEGLWGWIHARPAGLKMYERCGWRPVVVSEFDIPGVETAPVISMARQPDLSRKGVAMV